MPLRNILTVPPGGFRYSQTLANGTVKSWATMNAAWTLAVEIADYRAGNGLPRATPKEALADIDEFNCARLHNDPAHCVQKKTTGVRAAIARLSENVKAAGVGKRILVDWLGSGATPVAITQAQARADVCAGCAENKQGHSWLKLTADVVRAIAEQLQAKDSLKLRVANEERLGTCRICNCALPLKVHVPLATILEHTDDETLESLPRHCWQHTERNL